MLRKVIRDVAGIVRQIGDSAGVWKGGSLDFEPSWARVRTEVLAGVGSESSQADREDALCRLEDLVAMIAVRSGPLLADEVRRIADKDVIEALVADLAVAGPADPVPSTGVWGRLTGADDDEPDSPRGYLLDDVLGNPMRGLLWKRALLGATVAHAAVGAVELEARVNALSDEAE